MSSTSSSASPKTTFSRTTTTSQQWRIILISTAAPRHLYILRRCLPRSLGITRTTYLVWTLQVQDHHRATPPHLHQAPSPPHRVLPNSYLLNPPSIQISVIIQNRRSTQNNSHLHDRRGRLSISRILLWIFYDHSQFHYNTTVKVIGATPKCLHIIRCLQLSPNEILYFAFCRLSYLSFSICFYITIHNFPASSIYNPINLASFTNIIYLHISLSDTLNEQGNNKVLLRMHSKTRRNPIIENKWGNYKSINLSVVERQIWIW